MTVLKDPDKYDWMHNNTLFGLACGARPAEGFRSWGAQNPEGKICLVPLGGRLVRASTPISIQMIMLMLH